MTEGEMDEHARLLFRLRLRLSKLDMAMTLSASDRFLDEVMKFIMEEIEARGAK